LVESSSQSVPASPRRSFVAAFGPGLLFAGAAIGVSHLVQSTRAGAAFGVGMIAVVLLANVVKFPAFRFGPHFTAATGRPLLDGYRRQGTWVLVAFSLLTLATMFTITAVVTLVTAGVAIALFGLGGTLEASVGAANGPATVSAALLLLCAVLLSIGGYAWLDRFMKLVMPALTLATLVAAAIAIPQIDWSQATLLPQGMFVDAASIAFTVALVGWMPTAIDISVWSSLWTLARGRQRGTRLETRSVLLDFDVGYFATTVLAIAFVLLGTGLMHGRGIVFEDNAAKFANQVIDLYATTLGAWSRPLIGTAAFLAMLSTVVTVVDAFPRVIAALVAQFRVLRSGQPEEMPHEGDRRAYRIGFAVLCAGALSILFFAMSGFKALVDLATTLSFLTAPALAFFNHRAIFGPLMPGPARPGRAMWIASMLSIAAQASFAAWFLWVRFG
jgi:Mn2+/Fe2+ NRAMP family transporter